MPRPVGRFAICLLPALVAGCASIGTPFGHDDLVQSTVRERMEVTVPSGKLYVPDTVSLDDGLSESEAVQLALCNNAAFQELLVDLGLSHADLVQASLLPNPEVVYIFGTDPKPFKYLVELPLDAIVLRPSRMRAAGAEWERTRERLTQAGLDLIRDTRLAYADWVLAREKMRIAEENRQLRERIATLAVARRKAGDATPLEESTATIDNLRGKQESTRATNDLPIAEERLRNLTGLGEFRPDLAPQAAEPLVSRTANVDQLVNEALVNRPDVLSAQRGIEATEARLTLAHLGWLRFLGLGDATSGESGHNFSPGFRVGIPIFNWNQGAIARAEAERERAIRQLRTVRERAIQEVRQAHTLYRQADADYRQWTVDIRPAVDEAVRRAENTYKEGGTSLLLVLETSRQLIDTRFREAQLRADLSRTWAELERSVGRKIPIREDGFAADRATEAPKP
jgi:cobalt-zinc-cadmium efflux system outer membrane protein